MWDQKTIENKEKRLEQTFDLGDCLTYANSIYI